MSPLFRVTWDQETVWPVLRLARAGAVHGPVMTATGGLPKLPLFTHELTAGGAAVASENGTVNGTVNVPATGAGGTSASVFCCTPYLRMSGATSPIVNVTSQRVGYFSGSCPERRTSACFGMGSSYRSVISCPESPTVTACCSWARATSRRAWVCADAVQVRVMVRAAYHCGDGHAPWSPDRGITPAPWTGGPSQPVSFCHSQVVPLLSVCPNSMSSPNCGLMSAPVQ